MAVPMLFREDFDGPRLRQLAKALLRMTTAPELSAPRAWKTYFARSNPTVLIASMDASSVACNTATLA